VFTSERDAPFTSAGFARHDRWKGGPVIEAPLTSCVMRAGARSPVEGTTPLQAHLGDKNIRPEVWPSRPTSYRPAW
jgi:hypothetical protein